MNIQIIKDEAIKTAALFFHTIEDFALWSGHKIQLGFTNYLVPAIQEAWARSIKGMQFLFQFMKNSPASPFIIAGSLFCLGVVAFKFGDHHAYQQDLISKTAWRSLGVAAFVGATVITSIGIASLTVA
jgi:hypothetical protein